MDLVATTHHSRASAYEPPLTASRLERHGSRPLYVAGDTTLLDRPSIAIIGSRRANAESLALAGNVAAMLVAGGHVVLSGLAAGIDRAAHEATIREGGRTIAVIGTALDQAYPREHTALQKQVYRDHLLVSPFAPGSKTARWHFPARNRVMARLAGATVLVEASEESGTRHQVAECVALGRTVYARRGLVGGLSWLRCAADSAVVEWADARELRARLAEASERRLREAS